MKNAPLPHCSRTYAKGSPQVLLDFDPAEITLATLIEVHLRTHSCTISHVLRDEYRSSVSVVEKDQAAHARQMIALLQADFDNPIITRVLAFHKCEVSPEMGQNFIRPIRTARSVKSPTAPSCIIFENGSVLTHSAERANANGGWRYRAVSGAERRAYNSAG